jgi:hypothetical protein
MYHSITGISISLVNKLKIIHNFDLYYYEVAICQIRVYDAWVCVCAGARTHAHMNTRAHAHTHIIVCIYLHKCGRLEVCSFLSRDNMLLAGAPSRKTETERERRRE